MHVAFDTLGEDIRFRIHSFDPKYEDVLKMCYYQPVDDGYAKIYPRSAKYIDKMMDRYQTYAKAMFDQLGYFAEIPWQDGLEAFCARVAPTGIPWWLTGSCAACIRGVALNPHDIDIMVDSADVPRLTERFQDWLIEPILDTQGWVTKDFGVIFNHCRIDIASDPSAMLDTPEPADCGPYAKAHLETVTWRGYAIRIPPLDLQIGVNRRRGRMDRVAKMEAHQG